MPFLQPDDLPKMEVFPGSLASLAAGENIMLSFLDMAEGSIVPEHSHPHEQAGLVLQGRLKFRLGDEERVTGPGEAFIVPPNVVHRVEVVEGPAKVLDIFSPLREDYLQRYNEHTQTSGTTKWG
ncbi:MAG: cupin domain-containing protein [Candidatus Latescibacteria bacterium]|nr:cupin domain-containing protein [Candidatus Latescibacterota bacterium]